MQDPNSLHERLTRAFVEFLLAECLVQPVLIILEDLHWGDAPTVRLLDTALRELHELPLVIVVLARPEVDTQFPQLFAQRHLQRLPLWGHGRRACEQLIRA